MKKNAMTGLCILLVTCWLSGAYAEPDTTVTYLMEEPVTAFDLGLFQLEMRMKDLVDDDFIWISRADYNWKDNAIDLIFVTKHMAAVRTASEMRNRCQQFIAEVRRQIKPADLKKMFSHRGFTKPTAPQNLGGQMAALTRFQVHGYYEDGKKIICRGPLMGTDITFSE